ncbi:hypothetical protein OIU77_019296 [Salix suchowensis]|uniref:Uncharacterized protein n=1 Tax=Salix suchowensis TaxID=1278906 RepID=A0ABQ9CIY8_9ROSI|nr:hypothetical protein OIU77_019296 [Salix suchowensis]
MKDPRLLSRRISIPIHFIKEAKREQNITRNNLQNSQSRKMCYKVTCSTCGKSTWGGCGRHVPSVYRGIPEGQHCLCREWPGVDPKNPNGNGAGSSSSSSALFCDCSLTTFAVFVASAKAK